MERYFFHVLNQISYARDEVGVELSGLPAARGRASDTAGEILTSDLRDGHSDVRFEVQVENGAGVRVLTVHVASTVETAPAAA